MMAETIATSSLAPRPAEVLESVPCGPMPIRATKRGDERTPLDGSHDVLICGASFAGLAVARELAGSGADVLIVDRYEIGERQTSACGIPTEWLRATGPDGCRAPALRRAGHPHAPRRRSRYQLPWTFSTFDYRELCELLWERVRRRASRPPRSTAAAAAQRRRRDRGRDRPRHRSPRRWSSTRSAGAACSAAGDGYQPPDAPLSRGLEVHPGGGGEDLEIWIDRRYVPAGYGWSLPGRRRAADRGRLLRPALPRQGHDRAAGRGPRQASRTRYQGNWIPHKLRRGDRGRHLLRRRLGRPLPAAQRRGDPHRALLRDRPRAASCAGSSRAARAASRRRRATPSSTTRTSGSSAGCCGCRSWCRGSRRACSGR